MKGNQDMLKDIAEIIKTSGWSGLWRLIEHSNNLKKYARDFALINALLALEKCDLNRLFLSSTGLDISSQTTFDHLTLSAICEYMHETGILTISSSGNYKAKNKRQFEAI